MEEQDPYSKRSTISHFLRQAFSHKFAIANSMAVCTFTHGLIPQPLPPSKIKLLTLTEFQKIELKSPFPVICYNTQKGELPLRIMLTKSNFTGLMVARQSALPSKDKFDSKYEIRSACSVFHFQMNHKNRQMVIYLSVLPKSDTDELQASCFLSIDQATTHKSLTRKPFSWRSLKKKRNDPTESQVREARARLLARQIPQKMDFVGQNIQSLSTGRSRVYSDNERSLENIRRRIKNQYQREKGRVLISINRNFPDVVTEAQKYEQIVNQMRRNACLTLLAAARVNSMLGLIQQGTSRIIRVTANKTQIIRLVYKFIIRLKRTVRSSLNIKGRKRSLMFHSASTFYQECKQPLRDQALEILKRGIKRKVFQWKLQRAVKKAGQGFIKLKSFQQRFRQDFKYRQIIYEMFFQRALKEDKFFGAGMGQISIEMRNDILSKAKHVTFYEFTLLLAKEAKERHAKVSMMGKRALFVAILKEKAKREMARRKNLR